MGLQNKKNLTLKPSFNEPSVQTVTPDEKVELDIIQCLRNNIETLKKSQERVEFLNKELGGVLNFKNK